MLAMDDSIQRKHLVFVVNPLSGVDRVKAIEQHIEQYLDSSQYSYQITHTQYKGHGTHIAQESAQQGAYAVIAVGGDGSVHDVIQGLYGSACHLGIIPKGSGNGLARSMGIPLKLKEALLCINQNLPRNIDLVKVNQHFSASNAGLGFDALVCQHFAQSKKRGLLAYIAIINRLLWSYSCQKWQIASEECTLEEKAFLVNVANGRQFGYDFIIAENARYDDGIMDVVLIQQFPKIYAATLAWRMMRGTLAKSPFVKHFRTKKVTISNKEGIDIMQIDGEGILVKGNELTFELLPQAIKVLAP